jgi:hypothetical protein
MISVIHPSRGRPELAFDTMVSKWLLKNDSGKNIQYIVSVDEDDPELYKYKYWFTEVCEGIGFVVNPNKSAIDAINNAAKIATGDLLVVISDDMDCPERWDTLLLEAIGDKQDFCAKTSDGHQDWLITLPILDRTFYNRFGYVYHPDFKHMHCDLDLTCRAWMLDRYIELPLTFKHNHYSLTGQQPDEINRRNNATWGHGRMTFNERLARNFDLAGGLKPLPILPKY